jgi:CrcB protein
VKSVLYVCLGGALGALLRYGVALFLKPETVSQFPLHTFVVNLIGCLCIGWVLGWFATNGFNHTFNLFVVTGILGGFTTFSSFSAETLVLFKEGFPVKAITYATFSNILGVLLAWVGYESHKWI